MSAHWPAKILQQCGFDSTMPFVQSSHLCLSNLQHGQGRAIPLKPDYWDTVPSRSIAKSELAKLPTVQMCLLSCPCPHRGQCAQLYTEQEFSVLLKDTSAGDKY